MVFFENRRRGYETMGNQASKAEKYYAHTDPRFPGKLPNEPEVQWQLPKDYLIVILDLALQLIQVVRPIDQAFVANLMKIKWKYPL
jgi:soluble cytochrome b562